MNTTREGVYRGGNEKGVGLSNWFAQEINKCSVDTPVADTGGGEKKLHNMVNS
ncbi:MAG TPA: hypothetical protein VFE32_02625 [Puia sp.]|nr:hypothetical protein [Puia sp.]